MSMVDRLSGTFSGSVVLGGIAVAVGSVVSGFTTWFGCKGFLDGAGFPWVVAIGLSLALTFMIQALLVIAVFKIKSGRLLTKVHWLMVYAVTVFFSCSFSVGFWTHTIHGDDLTMQSVEKQLGPFLNGMQHYEQSFAAMATALGALSAHSEEMATLERTEGTSCGYRTAAKEGPRWELRKNDQETIARHSARAFALRDSLQRVNSRIMKRYDDMDPRESREIERQMKQALYWASTTRHDPQLALCREYLFDRVECGGRDLEVNGFQFDCPDAKFDALAHEVILTLDQLPPLPNPEELHFYHDEPAYAVRLVLESVARRIGGMNIGVLPQGREKLEASRVQEIQSGPPQKAGGKLEPLPIALGLMVDILILLAAVPPRRRDAALGPQGAPILEQVSAVIAFLRSSDQHVENVRRAMLAGEPDHLDLHRILLGASAQVGGEQYIYISEDMPENEASIVGKLMDAMVYIKKATPCGVRSGSVLGWLWRREWRDAFDTEQEPTAVWMLTGGLGAEELRLSAALASESYVLNRSADICPGGPSAHGSGSRPVSEDSEGGMVESAEPATATT